mgnify:CR=1 FL=1
MADFFVWGNGGQKLSQDDINDQLRYGDQLTQQAQQTPAYNWAQGASNILNSFMGGFEHGRAMKHQTENDDYNQEIIKNLYGGGENLPSFSGAGMDSPTAGDGQGAISAPARALAAQPDDAGNAGAASATPAAQRIGAAQRGRRLRSRLVFHAGGRLERRDRLHRAPERRHPVLGRGVGLGLHRRHARGEGGALALFLEVLLQALEVGQADLTAPHSPATVVRPGRPCSPCRRW